MEKNNITFLPVTTGFLVLLIIQRIILFVCMYDRPRANLVKRKRLHSNHGNEDCYTNLHVQIFASTILIDFVVHSNYVVV